LLLKTLSLFGQVTLRENK